MINYTSTTPYKGQVKTLRLKLDPRRHGTGRYQDVDGKWWDVRGYANDYVNACPCDEVHPFYSDTSGAQYGFVSQSWPPYRIEVVPA